MTRKTIFTFLRLVVSLTLVGIILRQLGGLTEVLGLIAGISPFFVILVLIVDTLDRALMTYKWGWLLRTRGVNLPFFIAMKIYCASMVWGMFLPTTVGADAIRGFATTRLGLDSKEVVASILVERMGGFVSAMVFGLLSLVLLSLTGSLDGRFTAIWWLAITMLAITIILVITSFSQRVFDSIHHRLLYRFHDTRLMRTVRQLHLTYTAYQHNRPVLVGFLLLTFTEQLIPILHAWFIAWGMGINVSILYLAGAVPLAILISRVPISIDGLGLFDGVFILLMSLAGVTPAQAIAIALVGRIMQTISWLPWWMAHALGNGRIQPPQPLVKEG